VYRTEVGGVERNALFDDPYYQSVGGELAFALRASGFFVELHGGAGKVLDTGTLSTKGYGALQQGLTFEGGAELGWRFANGLMLAGRYGYSFTRVSWAGFGAREYGPLTGVDQVHVGSLALSLAR